MSRINVNNLLEYHTFWRKNLPENTANQYISLSQTFLHKLEDKGGDVSGVTLSYPEDCSDFDIFCDYIGIIGYYSIDHIKNTTQVTFH